MKAVNKEALTKWCTTAEKTFPTGSFVWMFEYDEETQVAMSLN